MSVRLNLRRSVATGLAALFAAVALFLAMAPAAHANPANDQISTDESEWA